MTIYQTKWFARWANKEGLTTQVLIDAVLEIEQGLVDAYLGNHIVKKRIGVGGRGKSGGLRTILGFQSGQNAFFIFGFAKNQRDNLDERDLRALKRMASGLLGYDDKTLRNMINAKEIIEVSDEKT